MAQVFGLLLTGGEGPHLTALEPWLGRVKMVVAADSGYDLARRYGIEPDLVVGDFDSIGDKGALAGIDQRRVRVYPPDKDETDTEIGVRLLHEHDVTDVVIAGGGGGRVDHLFGILSLFDRSHPPVAWLSADAQILCIQDRLVISGSPGEILSFFPAGIERCTMRSTGLRWPLDGLEWHRGDVGVSNEMVSDSATVEMQSGRLIVVRLLERSDGR